MSSDRARAFGALRAIDLSDDEIQLVNRINAVRRTASSREEKS